jgi:hypothetical protein
MRQHRLLSVLLGAALALPALPAAAQPAPASFCSAGQAPKFQLGIDRLKQQLGPVMGDPVECEHADSGDGDTLQKTTTGLAYYRKSANLSSFTTGSDHWALFPQGLGHWTGDADPPRLTAGDVAYIEDLQAALEPDGVVGQRMIDAAADLRSGQLDRAGFVVLLTDLRGQAAGVADGLATLRPTPPLARAHQLATGLQNELLQAIDLLGQAVESEDAAEAQRLVAESSAHSNNVVRQSADLRAELIPFVAAATS